MDCLSRKAIYPTCDMAKYGDPVEMKYYKSLLQSAFVVSAPPSAAELKRYKP